ncbi:hypothetical protein JHK85_037525 [Glycine max]|nr:hypothetical protein JHK85_037525 [Glycine max]KAG4977503.1 hypothetical protein JHK86_036977 [Glycine max]
MRGKLKRVMGVPTYAQMIQRPKPIEGKKWLMKRSLEKQERQLRWWSRENSIIVAPAPQDDASFGYLGERLQEALSEDNHCWMKMILERKNLVARRRFNRNILAAKYQHMASKTATLWYGSRMTTRLVGKFGRLRRKW